MKFFERTSYIIVLTGFVLKLFHIPLNAYLIMLGLVMLFIFYLITSIKKLKSKTENIAGFSVAFSFTALLFNLKFYPFAEYIYYLACLVSLCFIGSVFISKKFNRGYFVLWIFATALLNTFKFTPASTKYYAWNIKYNLHIDKDYISWDKYSWFLYNDGKFEEALLANNKAGGILKTGTDAEFLKIVFEHHEKIIDRTWTSFK